MQIGSPDEESRSEMQTQRPYLICFPKKTQFVCVRDALFIYDTTYNGWTDCPLGQIAVPMNWCHYTAHQTLYLIGNFMRKNSLNEFKPRDVAVDYCLMLLLRYEIATAADTQQTFTLL